MFTVAVYTEMPVLESCAETHVMTGTGYQIITENEVYFVSAERFLKKYKGNIFIYPLAQDKLLSFDEAQKLRASADRIDGKKTIKVTDANASLTYDKNGADYILSLRSSNVEINANNIHCYLAGGNNNVKISTFNSVITIKSTNTALNINAANSVVNLNVSNCFIDLAGNNLDVMIAGNNNTINGITDGINVFSQGRNNEFNRAETRRKDSTEKPF